MKIYVPRYQHVVPKVSPENSSLFARTLVQIHQSDLLNVINSWMVSRYDLCEDDPNSIMQSVRRICSKPIGNGGMERLRFLWRPAISVHCGSRDGADHCKDRFISEMEDVGFWVAKHGFNLWYGGGNTGLMGATIRGFNRAVSLGRFAHQFSVQVVPGQFVVGVQSRNGLRPKNEGLGNTSDIAIVMPEFVSRRDILNSICVAAISGPGGLGTLDEVSDVLCHAKTGQKETVVHALNLHVEELGHGYFEPLRNLIKSNIICGQSTPSDLDCIYFHESTKDAFDTVLKTVPNPHEIYDKNMRAYWKKADRLRVPKIRKRRRTECTP